MPSVCAVIVTFNRKDVLARCLEAVLGQTRPPERILVVDNGSTDETRGYLSGEAERHPAISLLRLPENMGPAGGFEAGMREAVQHGCDYLWVMDDDILADEDCLEHLLAGAAYSKDCPEHMLAGVATVGEEAALWPRIFDHSFGRYTDYPGWHGFLIPRTVVERVGLPRGDLFWWIEDTEYLFARLSFQHGVGHRLVEPARVEHLGHARASDVPAWKYYYEVRNTVYYALYVIRRKYLKLPLRVLRALARAGLSSSERGKKMAYIGQGVYDGALGRLGKRVDPAA